MQINNELQERQTEWMAAISELPFIERLTLGTLTQNQRDYYVAQDHYYLSVFDSVFAETNHILTELGLTTINRDTTEVDAHQGLKPSHSWKNHPIGQISKDYVRFLEQIFEISDDTQKLLAVLPCLESYHLLAFQMKNSTHYHQSHPYKGWIDYYTDNQYQQEVLRNQKGIVTLIQDSRLHGHLLIEDILIYEKAYKYEYEFWRQCFI